MAKILVWENNVWRYDRFTSVEYEGEQPRPPLYEVGETVMFRGEKVKIEWCSCTIKANNCQVFWYDVRKRNSHSMICSEDELRR